MKKFRYRLERILQYRLVIKTEKLRELTLRNQELHEARERLVALEQEIVKERIKEGIVTIEELTLAGNYVERLRTLILRQHEVIEETEKKVQEALAAYIEAAKDAESLVKHKNNKRQEYVEYVEKETQKFLDELTVQRIGRLKSRSLSETTVEGDESKSTEELI